ncbi:hypothetical protein [Micromonospora sp. B006]|uniref:hypothetical protein n=1 Tax=Micromonospora sp. B006 TaxID=2201999 RepID=UPI000E300A6F|nr:hypothetical protein [Micromonospora sp. B006]AXO36859.1 proline and alanine rich protein EspI [Micromonospora sp. B006]
MSETGQPGAATPGEHGDGTGRQDEPARTGGGWAPPPNGWSRGAPAPGGWPYGDLGGWAASSPRHGDLPAPLPGQPEPSPVNGRHVNGVHHAGEESRVTRQAPVSAPPADDPPRQSDGERLAVPAPRPAPAVEQQVSPTDAVGSRHAVDDPAAAPRWAESGPASAPPALQVPPVGAAASGFEVPPGFHAPNTESTPSLSRGWADRPPAEPSTDAAGRSAQPAGDVRPPDGPSSPAEPRAAADSREPVADDPGAGEPDWSGPSWNRPSWGDGWAPPWARTDEPPARRAAERADRREQEDDTTGRRAGHDERGNWDDRAGHDDRAGWDDRAARDERAAEWAPEPVRPYMPARVEPPSGYEPPRPEPVRPYEPLRAEPAAGPEPTRPYEPEPPRPYESEPGRQHEPGAGPEQAREATRPFRLARGDAEPQQGYERPSWAGPPVPVTPVNPGAGPEPASAPPAPAGGYTPTFPGYPAAPAGPPPTAAPVANPATRATGEPADGPRQPPAAPARPISGVPAQPTSGVPARPISAVPAQPTSGVPAQPTSGVPARPISGVPAQPTSGVPARPISGAPAASGAAHADRTSAPQPASAPPYAARRSAPEPVPAADAAAEPRPEEPAPVVLPQRVPAEPDVPVVPEPPAVEPSAETPELARIATHLRRDDEPAPLRERPEGFDVNAILDAVREVAGVRDAALRRTPAGAHSLRLDLADGADPAEVSRLVARLLQERMGLAAAPQNLPGAPGAPPPAQLRRRSARLDRAGEGRPTGPIHARALPDETRTAAPAPRNGDEPGPAGDETPARTGVVRPAANRSGEGRFGGTDRAARPADAPADGDEPPRRRRQATHRGRAAVDETSLAAAPTGMSTGSPVTLGTSYSGGQMTTTETAPSRPLDTGGAPGPRVVIEHVLVSTFGLDATTEVRLVAGDRTAEGHATGPAVDGYVLRLCAVAAAAAVDELLGRGVPAGEHGRCFVEHAAVVPFGNCEVATVVVLLVCDGWVEQLAGSALVAGDPRQAVVRATLAAVNRRLEALLT